MASTARRKVWNGRRVTELKRYILARDNGICGLCGEPGADTIGHLEPYALRPDLAWDLGNMQAQHGRKRTRRQDGFTCAGNFSEGAGIRAEARRREREAAGEPPRRRFGRPYVSGQA